jgi:hypothetical protein
MRFSKGNLSGKRRAMLACLFLLPLVVAAGKSAVFPTSEFLTRYASLLEVPAEMHRRLQYGLFVPLSAVLVVLCRLTLGIRILGPFRSILIAVAFQITGIPLGLVFLTIVIAVIVVVRPLLKAIRLPYFARVSVIMSAVSAIMMMTILLGTWLEADSLRRTAYFPIVVLCLTGEGFSHALTKEGTRSAMWRGAMTVLLAVLITLLTEIHALQQLLLRFPELLIVQIGCVVVIAEYFDLRLLQWMNPAPQGRVSARRAKGKITREGHHDPCGAGGGAVKT